MEEDLFVALVTLDEAKVILHDRDDSNLVGITAPVENEDVHRHARAVFLDLSNIELNLEEEQRNQHWDSVNLS